MLELDTATDTELWDYARDNNYFIVSKDTDFRNRSVIHGYPPKVIWIRIGNCMTRAVEQMAVEQILRKHYAEIVEFSKDVNTGLFVLR